MSFFRLIFYHAVLGGWAAFAGWLVSEAVVLHRTSDIGWTALVVTAALVGAFIGGGIALVGALANGRFRGYRMRFAFCLLGGLIGGAAGGLIGNMIYQISDTIVLRALGWMIMGSGIGCVEGIFDLSGRKIRNGLIGGAVGGLLGGLCLPAVSSIGDMSGRAMGFVILGLSIGLFIGLAQIILREAWLTVEQGFRPGRQFVLNVPVTVLGTSEKAHLPFIAFGAKGVEPIHVRIKRQNDGTFLLLDNGSRTGTFINGERVQEEVLMNDDVIQVGPNLVRFREVVRHVTSEREARRKRLPPVPAAVPLPEALPVMSAPPVPQPMPAIAAGPPPLKPAPPRPMPVQATAVTAQPIKPAVGAAPRGKACPKCGKSGTPIPGTVNHLCMSCDLKYT